jgi:hypothetical protein
VGRKNPDPKTQLSNRAFNKVKVSHGIPARYSTIKNSVDKAFATLQVIQPGKEMLVRIVPMLSKLVERFNPEQYRARENASGTTQRFEDEDDDEHEK